MNALQNNGSAAGIAALVTAGVSGVVALGYGIYRLATRERPRVRIRYRNDIDAPAHEVLSAFSNPERLAAMMQHADIDRQNGKVRWQQRGPLGVRQEWSPRYDVDEDGRKVWWRTDDHSNLDAEGTVQVRETEQGTSEVEFETTFKSPIPVWPQFLQDTTRERIVADLNRVCAQLSADA